MAAVEFADASPEPALDTLYENLYVLDERRAAGTRSTSAAPSRTAASARTRRCRTAARELAEAGAAYAGQDDGPRPNPAIRATPDERAGGGRGPRSSRRGRRRASRRRATDGGAADARGAARRDGGGDAPRRGGLRDGRGRRRLPGRLQGDRGAARRVRRAARARHADLREHDRRRRGRRGDGRAAAGRRADDGQLLPAGARPDRQPRRRDPLHVQRPGAGADGDPDAGRRRPPARPDPLAQLRGALPAGAGPAGRLPLDPGRRQGAAEGGDPRRQPGDLHRAREPLRGARRGRRGRRRRGAALRRGGGAARGRRRDDRRHPQDGPRRRGGGADALATSTASRPR